MADKAVDGRESVAKAIKGDIYNALRESLTKPRGKGKRSWTKDFIELMLKEAKETPSGPIGQLIAKQLLQDDIITKLDAETDKYLSRDIDFARFRIMNTLYKEQRDVFLDKYRRKIIIGSRRIGKTELAARLLLEDAIYPNHHAIFVALKFENAIRQCYNLTLDLAKTLGFNVTRESKVEGEIAFSNGSNILFKGNSNKAEADKMLGYKFSCIVIDEVQNQVNLNYLIDTVFRPSMTDYPDSKILLIGTPPRMPHTAIENIWNTYKEWHHYSWDMRQNPFIQNVESEIEQICKDKGVTVDAPFIQREYFGQWVWDTEAQLMKGYKTYDIIPNDLNIDHIYIGNDYGWAAYNAVVGVACDTKKHKGYIYFCRKFNKATVSDIVAVNREALNEGRKILMEHDNDPGRIAIYGDTSDTSIIFEMARTYNMPAFQCYKYDKAEALTHLAEMCRKGDILIPRDSPLQEEFDMTLYKRDEQDNITPELDDDVYHPDALFALLYASRQWVFDWGNDGYKYERDRSVKEILEE